MKNILLEKFESICGIENLSKMSYEENLKLHLEYILQCMTHLKVTNAMLEMDDSDKEASIAIKEYLESFEKVFNDAIDAYIYKVEAVFDMVKGNIGDIRDDIENPVEVMKTSMELIKDAENMRNWRN